MGGRECPQYNTFGILPTNIKKIVQYLKQTKGNSPRLGLRMGVFLSCPGLA